MKPLFDTPESTKGQAMIQTLIVLPVVVLMILLIMQAALMYNAKQVVRYAAFCAARAGCVYNADGEKMHKAAAVALSCISPKLSSEITGVADDLAAALDIKISLPAIGNIPVIEQIDRYADALYRTEIDSIALRDGLIEVGVRYQFHCTVLPLGGLTPKNAFYDYISDYVNNGITILEPLLERSRRNISVRSICRLRHWPGLDPVVYVTGSTYHKLTCEHLRKGSDPSKGYRDFKAMTVEEAKKADATACEYCM